jgi:hypothetical protein
MHAAVVQPKSKDRRFSRIRRGCLTRTAEAITAENRRWPRRHALEVWRHAQSPVENNEQGAIAGASRADSI